MTLVNSRPQECRKSIPGTCLFTSGSEGGYKNRQFDASTCSSCRRFLAVSAPAAQHALRCAFPNATPGNRDLRQTRNLSVSVLSSLGVCFFFVVLFFCHFLNTESQLFLFSLCLLHRLKPSLPSVHCTPLPQSLASRHNADTWVTVFHFSK